MSTAVSYLARADLLLLLAEMLDEPSAWPAPDAMPADDQVEALARLAGLDRIAGAGHALRFATVTWAETERDAAWAERGELFEGRLSCAPNETIFVRRDKGAVLADIAGFYRAFGFTLAETFREKHDHLRAELQFVALLHVQIARAAEAGQDEQREIARDALRAFLRDHLGLWIGAFAARLETTARLPLFRAVAPVLAATWLLLQRAEEIEDLTLDPAQGALAVDQGTPYECGMCTEDPAS